MKALKIGILFSIIVGMSQAWSQVRAGQLVYGGTGCPKGTAFFNGKELELDQFKVEVSHNKTSDRKTCNLSLPVSVSRGYQVGIVLPRVDLDLELVSSASVLQLNAEIFFVGSEGPKLEKKIVGPKSREMTVTPKEKVAWAPCGSSVNLRLNLAAVLQSSNGENSAVMVQSIHRKPKSLFLMRKCAMAN